MAEPQKIEEPTAVVPPEESKKKPEEELPLFTFDELDVDGERRDFIFEAPAEEQEVIAAAETPFDQFEAEPAPPGPSRSHIALEIGASPDGSVSMVQSRQSLGADDLAGSFLLDPSLESQQKVSKAREALDAEKVGTVGEAYFQTTSPSLAKQENLALGSEMDVVVVSEQSDIQIAQELDGPAAKDLPTSLRAKRTFMPTLAKEVFNNKLPEGFDGTWENVESWDDFIEFIDPVPFEKSMDVNWSEAMHIMMNGGELTQFKTAMRDRYGEDWLARWISFGVKELSVDMVILAVGAVVPFMAPLMYAGKGARLTARARAVTARAVAIGVGGGSVQTLINKQMGGPRGDFMSQAFVEEVAIRAGASVVGEGVFKLGAMGINKALGRGRVSLAKVEGVKPIKASALKKIINPKAYKNSHFALAIRANLRAVTEDYGRLVQKISDGVARKADIVNANNARTNAAKLLNVDENILDMNILSRVVSREIQEPAAEVLEAGVTASVKKIKAVSTSIKKVKAALKKERALARAKPKVSASALKARVSRLNKLTTEQKKLNQTKAEAIQAKQLATKKAKSPTENELTDALLTSEAVMLRTMGQVTVRQGQVADEFLTFFDRETFQLRSSDMKVDEGYLPLVTSAKKMFNLEEPEKAFGALGSDLFGAANVAAKISKSFGNMQEVAMRGLSRKEKTRILKSLDDGAANKHVFSEDEIVARGLSLREADAYYAMRSTIDIAHHTYDRALVEALTNRGVKSYKGEAFQILEKEAGKNLSAAQVKKGFVYVEALPRSGVANRIKQVVHKGELDDLKSVLKYEVGYTPRVYEKPRYAVSVINGKSGTIGRAAQFYNQVDATKFKASRETLAQKDEIVVMSMWDEQLNVGSLGIGRRSIDLMDALDQASRDKVKEAMRESGMSAAGIRKVINNLDGSSLRTRFAGERSERGLAGKLSAKSDLEITRLEQALKGVTDKATRIELQAKLKAETKAFTEAQKGELKPTGEAIAEYLNAVATRAGTNIWREHAINSFKMRFKDILDPAQPWFAKGNIRGDLAVDTTENALKVAEMQRWRGWLTKVIRNKTNHEQAFDNFMVNAETRATAVHPVLGRLMARMPGAQTLINTLRGTAAVTRLGSFAMAQLFVQGSQMAVTLGAKPIFAIAGMRDMIAATAGTIVKQSRGTPPSSLRTLIDAAERSGYLADLTTNDIVNLVGYTGNGFRAPLRETIDQSKNLINASLFPFRLGEQMNRGLAFFTIRREAMALAKTGKLQNLNRDGLLTVKDIDGDEFLRVVSDKAKLLALNMGKAGELQGFSGVGSVLFQFKQVLPKFLNVFETSQLKTSEKIGAGMALFGLYGTAAIPLMSDMFAGADAIARIVDSSPSKYDRFTKIARAGGDHMAGFMQDLTPEFARDMGMDKKFYNKFFKDGLIAASTKTWSDSEWNIANRVALGKFIQDSAELQDPWDFVVSFSTWVDILDAVEKTGAHELLNIPAWLEVRGRMAQGADFQTAFTEFFDGTDQAILVEALRGDRTLGNASLHLMKNFGKAVSSVGALSRALNVSNREVLDPSFRTINPNEPRLFDTSSGRLLATQDNPSRRTQLYLGITPGEIVEGFRREKLEKTFNRAVREYTRLMITRYINSPKSGDGAMDVVEELIAEIERTKTYMRGLGIPTERIAKNTWKSVTNMLINAARRQYIPVPTDTRLEQQ